MAPPALLTSDQLLALLLLLANGTLLAQRAIILLLLLLLNSIDWCEHRLVKRLRDERFAACCCALAQLLVARELNRPRLRHWCARLSRYRCQLNTCTHTKHSSCVCVRATLVGSISSGKRFEVKIERNHDDDDDDEFHWRFDGWSKQACGVIEAAAAAVVAV